MESNTEMHENRFLGSFATSSIRNLLSRSVSSKQKMKSVRSSSKSKSKSGSENTPPIDPNVQIDNPPISPSIPKKSPAKVVHFQKESTRSRDQEETSALPSDPSVKIVVRIRPVSGNDGRGDWTVRKVSSNSLSVADRTFTFDSVVDSNSNQEDVFQLVGVPLVKNSLAGFNTSILSYGQTGSGKSYTMWGPPSAMVEGHSPSSHQGIVPRIFQMLFSEIQREREDSEEKQINYQCRCSFLEIYNEQIGDLLDPTQRNLEIRDDAKNGFYVENLTEEYVTSYEDVTQILIKGLSSRKVGTTSINSKSSRSHIVFTCVIESWCKGISSTCFSSSKTSRISLVDLAGSERNKLDDAGRQCVKEGKNVKKSLSLLGHLVNILAEGSQSGKSQNIPYRSSCLTHLLRESLGGNAKLTVICAISPFDKCKGETLSTLRFGQRAKSIKNEPVINEITEDAVNDLSDQIRQLKEELIREKSNLYNSAGSSSGYFKGRNARESLNQLRLSLNRSLILPRIDNDSEEELNVNEEDVRELRVQLDNLNSSCEGDMTASSKDNDCMQFSSIESFETAIAIELDTSCTEESKVEESKSKKETPHEDNIESVETISACSDISNITDTVIRSSLSIRPCRQSPVLQAPTLSESPKIENIQRRSIVNASNLLKSQNHLLESSKFNLDVSRQSLKRSDHIRSSLQSNKIFSGPTQSLAASLHRGLQIIDYHQKNSASHKSSVALSFEHLTLKQCQAIGKADAGVQALPEQGPSLDESAGSFMCASCKRTGFKGSGQGQDSLNMWITPVDEAGTPEGSTDGMPKDVEKLLEEAIKREKELENICAEQAAKIEQLNNLVEQHKHERERNPITEQGQEMDTFGLEALKEGVIPIEDHKNVEYSSLEDENQLMSNYENHPVMLKANNESKELEEELDHEHRNTSFHTREREELIKEIEHLRSKLQLYMDDSSDESIVKQRSSSLLLELSQLRKSGVDSQDKSEEELEKERQRWTEMESEWISLTDELRIDLESNRRHAEKMEIELRLEKECTAELDDTLQRAVLGHARIIEHYVELQEKHNDLLGRHRKIMEGIVELKKAAAKAGSKGTGSRFFKSLAAELSASRVVREREMEYLKKENKSLKIQLRDTAEAVHAAGELLVRLREAEEAASVVEENFMRAQQEAENVKKQMEKLKRKHKMEMVTMKQCLAESRLPESALRPLYREDSDIVDSTANPMPEDDQAWRAEFSPIYQEHY
ncbi:hypothetical protein HHK36_002212 [Tetracentron sinense]|uniref:Kinesin motor domain-containing protein n=1 Tax=Tetracentron sinense TaxID=13715 RepID=A0A835DVT2_TETSI|nr:hypothetical protein HHK36_002212 [Tetracentron sinense]